MERKASFSIRPPKKRSSQHNSRLDKPKYLIENELDFDGNFYARYNGYQNDSQMVEFLEDFYKEKFGQNMQAIQKPALIKEVVISLKKEHKEKDVVALFDELKKKYGGHEIFEVAIHRDEGYFLGKDGLSYYPNTDIFYNDKEWYLDDNFTKKAPHDLEKIYNYHAHVKFTMMNLKTAKTPQMPKAKYSERHKIVADFLGLVHAPGATRFQKKSVNQIKQEYHENRGNQKATSKEKIELKATIEVLEKKLAEKGKVSLKDLAELKEEFRKEMIASELFYTKEDYQKLNDLFKKAKELNKAKDLNIQNLISETEDISKNKTKYKALKKKVNEQEVTISEKEALIVSGNTKLAEKIKEIEALKIKEITMTDVLCFKVKNNNKITTIGKEIDRYIEENMQLKSNLKEQEQKIGKLEGIIVELRATVTSLTATIKGFLSSKLSAILVTETEQKQSKGIEFVDNRENDGINFSSLYKR